MKNFSDIKHRIKSISDTRKITGAMETISVAKMRKALRRYENNKAYFETIRGVISDIILRTEKAEHKVFMQSAKRKAAFIAIASDKGLAGGFNHNILAFAEREITRSIEPHVFAVGQVCEEYFTNRGIAIDGAFADASYEPSVKQAAEMSERVYSMFDRGEIDEAYIIYTAMEGRGKMTPSVLKLLPFDRNEVLGERDENIADGRERERIYYEPSPEEVLATLIPQYLTAMIYGALIQSSACEHSQRRSAMNSATRNANELLEKLQVDYNRARQETVTDELSEIVTAANGVQNENRN
ncbi:MAG: ATP synthase F1 subunit gamma [Clostridia bacterium]|jgi:F-type H+-transporting ATPase subunit gamma|nr:ATP synthase F1 subunit gamma [Clostridia bacterium]